MFFACVPVLDHGLDSLEALPDGHAGARLIVGAQLSRDLVLVNRNVVDLEDRKQELAIHFGWEMLV